MKSPNINLIDKLVNIILAFDKVHTVPERGLHGILDNFQHLPAQHDDKPTI